MSGYIVQFANIEFRKKNFLCNNRQSNISQIELYPDLINRKNMNNHSKSRLIVVSLRLPFVVSRKDDGTIGRTESRDEMYRTMSHVVLQCKKSKWIGNPGASYQKVSLLPFL